jgi:hypothetical protein
MDLRRSGSVENDFTVLEISSLWQCLHFFDYPDVTIPAKNMFGVRLFQRARTSAGQSKCS